MAERSYATDRTVRLSSLGEGRHLSQAIALSNDRCSPGPAGHCLHILHCANTASIVCIRTVAVIMSVSCRFLSNSWMISRIYSNV